MRAFFGINVSLFVGLMLGMVADHLSSAAEATTVAVPTHYESEAVPVNATMLSADDEQSAEELPAEDNAGGELHPAHARAREVFGSGNVAEAIAILSRLRAERPADVALLNDLGVYHLSARHLAAAEEAFTAAVRVDPDYARAHYNLGTTHLKNGRYDAAETALTRALEITPYYGEARYNRALARTRLGDLTGAEADYEFLAETDRSATSAKAHYNRGVLLARLGRLPEAIAALRRALRARPAHIAARFNVALLLSRSGLDSQAADDYRKLLSLEPDHRAAGLNLGAILMRQETWQRAAQHFEGLVSRHPRDAAIYYNLALCRVQLEDNAGAVGAFEQAVELDDSYAEAHYNLALAYRRDGRASDAVEHFSRACELRTDEPTYRYNLALALTDAGRLDQAITEYETALDLDPEYFRALYNLGLAEFRAERYDAAREHFERALEVTPDSYNTTYNLGLTRLKLAQPAQAETALRRAFEFSETIEARYNLALAIGRQGRLREAIEEYRAALRLDPKHAPSIERLAESLAALGDDDRALSRLVLLQKLDPTDPTAFNHGLGLFRTGEYEKASRYFDVSSGGRGRLRRKSLNMKGASFARSGKPDDAIAIYREALIEYPGDGPIVRNLARAMEIKRDYRGALVELERLVETDADDYLTVHMIGREHQLLGDNETAATYYRQVLALSPDYEQARQALVDVTTARR